MLDEILGGYQHQHEAVPSQVRSQGSKQRPQAKAAPAESMSAAISALLNEKKPVPMQWDAGCGPLPGTPELDWSSLTPTGKVLGKGSFGRVLEFKAKREKPSGTESKSGSEKEMREMREMRLAAKILFDQSDASAAANGTAGANDKLLEEFLTYRSIIDAKLDGKPLGTHPNLCEMYGIVTMTVKGVPLRAILMEAVSGRDAQTTADTLRRCLEANYLTAREFWGSLQYLCDGMLAAAGHLEKAGIVHREFKQENVLVGRNGDIKVIDYGLAAKADDRRFGGTQAYMPHDYRDAEGVTSATDVYAIGATAAEMAEGWERTVLREGADSFETLLPKDQMMDRDEAQAVIRTAFRLADIEGQRRSSDRWRPNKDAGSMAKRSIMDERERMGGAGNRSSAPAAKDPTPPSLSEFQRQPDLDHYLALQRHLRNTRNQGQEIEKVLSSLPAEALKALNQEIAETASIRGKALLAKGTWLTELKSVLADADKDGNARPKQAGSGETAIEAALKPFGKSIEDLRAYIAEAGTLFADLHAVSHSLTPVDWKEVSEVGSLTKFALNLRAQHLGLQQVALLKDQGQG